MVERLGMKRFGHLFERAVSFSSLVRAAHRAFRHNRDSKDAQRFMFRLEPEALRLKRELDAGVYQPGGYRTFKVWDPKERDIAAAPFRDRVVHHAICAVLEPIFERRYISDSYACRPMKGTHRALSRAHHFTRRFRYFLKCDVRKYFQSVDHALLKAALARGIKDGRFLDFLHLIVDHNDPKNPTAKGIPIGNLTSQHFANIYLDTMDHFAKETLRLPGYLRYMDDFLCFSDDKEELHQALAEVRDLAVSRLALSLKDEKCYVAPVSQGIPFLGFRIYSGTIRLSRPSLVRSGRKLRSRLRAFDRGDIDEDSVIQSTQSIIEHIRHANTLNLRRTWLAAMG